MKKLLAYIILLALLFASAGIGLIALVAYASSPGFSASLFVPPNGVTAPPRSPPGFLANAADYLEDDLPPPPHAHARLYPIPPPIPESPCLPGFGWRTWPGNISAGECWPIPDDGYLRFRRYPNGAHGYGGAPEIMPDPNY